MHPVQSGVKRKLGVPFGYQSYLAGEVIFFVKFYKYKDFHEIMYLRTWVANISSILRNIQWEFLWTLVVISVGNDFEYVWVDFE